MYWDSSCATSLANYQVRCGKLSEESRQIPSGFGALLLLWLVFPTATIVQSEAQGESESVIPASISFKSERISVAVPKIDRFYEMLQDRAINGTLKKGDFPKLVTELRKDIGPESMSDPYVQYLIAVIECDNGIDRAPKLRQLAESNRGFWESWQAAVTADLIYSDVRKATLTLKQFHKSATEYCQLILQQEFNEEYLTQLERAAEAIKWIQDAAKVISEFELGKNATAAELMANPKSVDMLKQILEYGTTKESESEAKQRSDAATERKRLERRMAKTAESRSLLEKWSSRIGDGWDEGRRQFAEARDKCLHLETDYRAAAGNLKRASRALDQANSRLRAAKASNNLGAINSAAADVAALDPPFQLAETQESRARGKYADAVRKLEAAQRMLVNRANAASNFNRSFAIRYGDIVSADAEIRSRYEDFRLRLSALDYREFVTSQATNSNVTERMKAKIRQLELAMRIPISIDEILETAKVNAKPTSN